MIIPAFYYGFLRNARILKADKKESAAWFQAKMKSLARERV